MRKSCLNKVYELAKGDERVIFIGSDLGSNTLDAFKSEIPGRFFMEGISEANVVGIAAGLALEGKIVYVNTIATFLSRRCYDQIAMDLCFHNLPVRLIGNGGGFVYAPLGPTHQAIEDMAIMRALPNMTIIAPADSKEMNKLMPETLEHEGPIYVRLAKGYDPIVTMDDYDFKIGQAYVYRQGLDALVVTTGVTLQVALAAAEALNKQGIELTILHCPTVKPFDSKTLLAILKEISIVVTVEEHTLNGGLGSVVAEVLAETHWLAPVWFQRIGIPDTFADEFGSQASLMERFGITSERLQASIKNFLPKKTKVLVEAEV